MSSNSSKLACIDSLVKGSTFDGMVTGTGTVNVAS